jgi:hypothetical protein
MKIKPKYGNAGLMMSVWRICRSEALCAGSGETRIAHNLPLCPVYL